jgi:hypothetical protein
MNSASFPRYLALAPKSLERTATINGQIQKNKKNIKDGKEKNEVICHLGHLYLFRVSCVQDVLHLL